jgi:outer membrane protein assembly factor BamA
MKAGEIHTFGGVTVDNQTERPRLRGEFLQRRFQHLEGKTYDPEKVDEVYRELLRTGLFSNLRLGPVSRPGNLVRLEMTFEEARAREVGFTLGYGTYDGFQAGVRLADRNLLGRGRPLGLSVDYSERGLEAELSYVDPWFLDHPRLNFRARAFSVARRELGYDKDEYGLRGEWGWRILPRVEAGLFAQVSDVEVVSSGIAPSLLGPMDYRYTVVGLRQTTDFTDSQIAPTRGWIFSTVFDVALVDGEAAFTRGVGRVSYYLPLGKWQMALGARVGALQPIADGIPIDARFFNGGATTVRSFAERELGPQDDQGNPLGGEFYTVLNAEMTFPLSGALQGAVFVDMGNLTAWEDAGWSGLRTGVGLGLRYALPVGPLRVDYGVNADRKGGEAFGAFHFSFGVAF